MATSRILNALAAVSCMAACGGTHLTVRVDPAKAGFHAVVGPLEERCVPAGRRDVTDDAGVILITEEFCGKLQLVVAAPNYETQRRVLDTCDTKFVQVDMKPAKPVANPNDACGTAAMRVMRVWLSHDPNALRDELVDPNDLPLYQRESHLDPWQIAFEPGVQHADECSVQAHLFYEAGCEASVRVDLLRVGDAWRLRGVQDPG